MTVCDHERLHGRTGKLDAHESPPPDLKHIFKKYQKIDPDQMSRDSNILDFRNEASLQAVTSSGMLPSDELSLIFGNFMEGHIIVDSQPLFTHSSLPGLLLLPALLPVSVQKSLLSRLIHRDLSNEHHLTNLHLHYDFLYPASSRSPKDVQSDGQSRIDTIMARTNKKVNDKHESLFSYSPSSPVVFPAKNPLLHRDIPISKVMNKSLRWLTLGGQYDWTRKVYPDVEPPAFPSDVKQLLERTFPKMKAQAAILNFYSPGDTLSLHRDVSEKADKGLVSISIGCDCLFVIGLNDASSTIVVRLRSGDALYMSEQARYAWHGVPKIIPDTCPTELTRWPAEDGQYEEWSHWLSKKRINLNVRQMFED